MRSRRSFGRGTGFGLVDDGFILLDGPLSDEHRVAHVVEAESEEAVDALSGTHLVVETIDPSTIRLDGRPRSTST
jgi:hypothetical protein